MQRAVRAFLEIAPQDDRLTSGGPPGMDVHFKSPAGQINDRSGGPAFSVVESAAARRRGRCPQRAYQPSALPSFCSSNHFFSGAK